MIPLRSGYRITSWRWWAEVFNPMNYWRWLRWTYQRADRGFADWDWWDFDSYLAEMIPKALEKYKTAHTTPINPDVPAKENGEPVAFTQEEWNAKLDTMIAGFHAATDIIELNAPTLPNGRLDMTKLKEWEEEREATRLKGFAEFTKFFFALWD